MTFRNAIAYLMSAMVFGLIAAKPLLPVALQQYVFVMMSAVFYAGVGIILAYNKFRFGAFLPGYARSLSRQPEAEPSFK
jgi:hypothetical protein